MGKQVRQNLNLKSAKTLRKHWGIKKFVQEFILRSWRRNGSQKIQEWIFQSQVACTCSHINVIRDIVVAPFKQLSNMSILLCCILASSVTTTEVDTDGACSTTGSYELIWIRRTCDYVQLNVHYCVLFSSRVMTRIRVWIRFLSPHHTHYSFNAALFRSGAKTFEKRRGSEQRCKWVIGSWVKWVTIFG